jgi:16S rRNA (guanine527-N7)-methyltransferase
VSEKAQELWGRLAQRAGVVLDSDQISALGKYLDLLLEANQRMNLTRISDRGAAELLHVADALTVLGHLPEAEHRLADLGSGGGVPGIVLGIARRNCAVTLIESTRKKADFLREAVKILALENVSVAAIRAEEAGRGKLREGFDVVVARAVGVLPILIEWMLPLVKVGGRALAMKGPKAREEIEQAKGAITALGGGNVEIVSAQLEGAEGHVIVKIGKIRPTPARFPRDASISKGKPI